MNPGIEWLIRCGLANEGDTFDTILERIKPKNYIKPTPFGAVVIAVLFQEIGSDEACKLKDEIFSNYTREITPAEVLSDKFVCDCSKFVENYPKKYNIVKGIADKWKIIKKYMDPFKYMSRSVWGFAKWSEITAKRLARYPGWENLAPPKDYALGRIYEELKKKYGFYESDNFDKFIIQRKFDNVRGKMCEILYHYADNRWKI